MRRARCLRPRRAARRGKGGGCGHRSGASMAGLVIGGFKGLLAYRPRIDRARIERSGMTVSRALPLAFALAVLPLWPAAAQFGGMAGEAVNTPQEPRPARHQVLGNPNQLARQVQALLGAPPAKEPPDGLSELFRALLNRASQMLPS